MRWVIMIVVALVAAIIAVFAAGAVLPRKHVAAVMARINQPQQTVWLTITDHADDPKWRHDLASIQQLPDRNGHPVWQEIYKEGMRLQFEDVETVAPNKLVREVKDTGNMFSGRWEIAITPAGDAACTVRITEYGEVPNPFFRFMSRFVFGQTKSMEQYLMSLAEKYGEKPAISK